MTTSETDRATVPLDAATAGWVTVYRDAQAQIARMEEVKAEARRHLEAALGDAETGTVDNKPAVRWTVVTSRRLDQQKLKENESDIVECYTAPVTSRRFMIVDET